MNLFSEAYMGTMHTFYCAEREEKIRVERE